MSSVPHTDRAGVVTANVLLVVRKALLAWLNGDDLDFTFVRAEIAAILRDEFHDATRQAITEIRLAEPDEPPALSCRHEPEPKLNRRP